MKHPETRFPGKALGLAFLFAFALTPAGVLAQTQDEGEEQAQQETADESSGKPEELGKVVVTGTRKAGLSPTETLSPIDVFDDELLTQQADFDLTESFTNIAPSFTTQRFPIADGTAFVRPVTLRNLSPDHTLVLINGVRRHRSALVNLQLAPLGTVNQGAQAVDFATIPSAAISHVEVLRDGASAQYGSDAIAGVVNIILKDSPEGWSVSGTAGEYSEGDGFRSIVSGNAGFPLGYEGFINATVEYASSDTTSRGVPRPDAEFVASVVGQDQVPLNGFGQRWGDPAIDALKFFVNMGHPFGDASEFYSYLSYAEIETISDFFYRTPVLPNPADQQVVAARTTLQIDSDGDGLPDPAPQSLVDDIIAAGLNPADYLVPDASSSSG